MNLDGANALVTGANRGIGRALVQRLAAEPLGLVLAGVRSLERFEPVSAPLGGAREVRAVRMDLSSRGSIDACCDQLGDELCRIELLFNNAGLVYGQHLDISGWGKISPAEWAAQVVEAVKADRRMVLPRGKARLAVLAARGPSWLLDRATARVFSRDRRR